MTTYHVVESLYDYEACYALMAKEGVEGEITFPTVMAIDADNNLVGLLATRPSDDMVLAGPMVLDRSRRRVFTAINLVQHYEHVMRDMGIKRIVVGVDSDGGVKKGLLKWFPDVEPYGQSEGIEFYIWNLDRGNENGIEGTESSGSNS